MPKDEDFLTKREFEIRFDAHQREHDLHQQSHDTEHDMTELALNKADQSLERRLEGMNEFRAQLEKQAAAFLTREIFDQYSKEQAIKTETAHTAISDKYDAIIKAIVSRHDADHDAQQEALINLKDFLQKEIQSEKEYRKTFEGSMNTWKWIATFLGASGVGGVLYVLIQGAPK